ncbi:MAG: UvrD-helicase domain-containing protein [Bacteroidales bacterium]|nr:UvrD-helicase domain-containing protein [Bacteroidales bacterium]HOY38042.1 UvrD-helicase domain-containing protein [Bacteroidales bacterium]HQP03208.1 UvrD-helicase domain-containing protein [Bacteroidales bacterium]
MSLLHVYSASAGAGKTHRLTGDCLRLLVNQPDAYRHILAVTFTNKASEEMKERILNELYNLSSGNNSDFLAELCHGNPPAQEKIVRKKAEAVLNMILHDYGRFLYMTIDSFFQRILRNFMREMNLNSNFELELDSGSIVNQVVDQMLDDTANDEDLLEWVLEVVTRKMDVSGSWDFRSELVELFNELFKEKFAYIEKIYRLKKLCRNDVKKLVSLVTSIENKHENFIKKIGSEAEEILIKHNLTPENFHQKNNGPAGFLLKLRNGFKEPGVYFLNGIDNEDKFIGKAPNPEAVLRKVYPLLNALSKKYLDWCNTSRKEFFTAKQIRNNIYLLGLIVDGKRRLADYLNENDRFFIGDTPLFLAEMSENNDAPFIFEKAGIMLKHYLIDEFQDTSIKQWEAFLPLLKECISDGNNYGLVVGDVKQSIFRWRNGSWKILAEDINTQFSVKRENLSANWRSLENIVTFNNTIFGKVPEMIQNHFNSQINTDEKCSNHKLLTSITSNYAEVSQNVKAGPGGHVRVKFFTDEPKQGTDWELSSMQETIERIDSLLLQNFNPGNIAILVRTHTEAKRAAALILEHQSKEKPDERLRYPVVSSESLVLSSNPAIIVITGIMRYILEPGNTIALYTACLNYLIHFTGEEDKITNISAHSGIQTLTDVFPDDFGTLIDHSAGTDLIALAESIIAMCKLNEFSDCIPFIDSFVDCAADFSRSKGTGLSGFLEWWESDGSRKSLQMPDSDNALRILTIHQSKGLGFDVVFLPFCEFYLEPKEHYPIIWADTSGHMYDAVPFIPLKYNAELGNTDFCNEYFEEKLNCYLDKLNLAYVAFTRAKKAMYIHCPSRRNDNIESSVSGFLQTLLQGKFSSDDGFSNDLRKHYDVSTNCFEVGHTQAIEESSKRCSIEAIHPVVKNKKQAVTHGDYTRLLEAEENLPVEQGILYHKIFENIRNTGDIEKAINQVHAKNLLPASEKPALTKKIAEIISQPKISDWFTGYTDLHRENWILAPDGSIHKPDRVMSFDDHIAVVDYKFGNKRSAEHINQVFDYMQLISLMGKTCVKGYVWYVFGRQLIEINMKKEITLTELIA